MAIFSSKEQGGYVRFHFDGKLYLSDREINRDSYSKIESQLIDRFRESSGKIRNEISIEIAWLRKTLDVTGFNIEFYSGSVGWFGFVDIFSGASITLPLILKLSRIIGDTIDAILREEASNLNTRVDDYARTHVNADVDHEPVAPINTGINATVKLVYLLAIISIVFAVGGTALNLVYLNSIKDEYEKAIEFTHDTKKEHNSVYYDLMKMQGELQNNFVAVILEIESQKLEANKRLRNLDIYIESILNNVTIKEKNIESILDSSRAHINHSAEELKAAEAMLDSMQETSLLLLSEYEDILSSTKDSSQVIAERFGPSGGNNNYTIAALILSVIALISCVLLYLKLIRFSSLQAKT